MVARFQAPGAGDRRPRSGCGSRRGIGRWRRRGSRRRRPSRSSSIATSSKQDGAGYLLSGRHSTIYLFDVATKKLERLTTGKDYDESAPSWSPDGSRIAFISNHAKDPDRDPEGQVYVADARSRLRLRRRFRRSTCPPDADGPSGVPTASRSPSSSAKRRSTARTAWSGWRWSLRDGSGKPTLVKATADLDRGVSSPHFTADGRAIDVLVADDRSAYPARVPLTGGAAEKLMKPPARDERSAPIARLLGRHRRQRHASQRNLRRRKRIACAS